MATQANLNLAQQLYVAYYGRPADPKGLTYWADQIEAKSVENVVNAFGTSEEFDARFGDQTNEQLVNNLYNQMFGRNAELEGLNYYSEQLASGESTLAEIALDIANGAQNEDATALSNKVAVADAFTTDIDTTEEVLAYQGTDAAQAARDFLSTVDETTDPAAVNVEAELAELVNNNDQNPGQAFTLTTGVDTETGTANDDTFVGVSDGVVSGTVVGGVAIPATETFGGLDVINGGAGTDTLKLTNTTGTLALDTSVTVSNVENLELTSAQNDITADVQAWSGLESVTVDQKGNAEAIDIDTRGNVKSVNVMAGSTAVLTGGANEGVAIDDNGTAATTADALATVSVTGAKGAIGVTSDALADLTLVNSAVLATVTNTTANHTLNVTANNQSGAAGVVDANAATVNVAATGANSAAFDVDAAAATAINFSGDKNLTATLNAQAANLNITSATEGNLTIGTALDTDVTFTGGAGKETITLTNANTKATAMGAGDDVVNVSGTTLGANGTIDGGEGTDTLALSSADAAALTANATYEARIANFEQVSLGAVAANTDNTVNLANLDDISYVASAGTAAGGTNETAVINFADLSAGASITIAGRTVTASSGDATAAQVATAFGSGASAGTLTVSGTLNAWTAAAANGEDVTFTSTTTGDVGNLTPTFAGVAAPTAPSVATTNGTGSSDETADVTFTDLAIGQSVTVAGLTIAATGGPATATEVAAAVAGGTAGNLTVTGTTAGWAAGGASGATVTYTSTTANTNVQNLDPSVAGTPAPTVDSNTPADGTAGASLTVTNMANAGTFELTGAVGGAATVTMKDATGTADSLNIKLNGANNITNAGTLTVAGVETINLEATDSSADTTALNNPAAASTPNLVAADATTIVVSGNHGVDFTGSTLTNVTELDASGVVATGATSSATAAQIQTAGAVTFSSAVTDKAVTVTTGNGADVISTASVNDGTFVASGVTASTISTGAGNDTITGSAGKDVIEAGEGRDTVNASAEADTITLGEGNDVYVLGAAANSTVAKADVITDFNANTYGQGTNNAADSQGADDSAGNLANFTGDTIDVTGLLGAGVNSIDVFVASNASDAQTFLQNTGTGGALTGFALDSSSGKLYMDLDANGTADSVIELQGVTTIDEAAFVIA